jgi:uncharacterized damage-inducible protein DinB
MSLLARMYSHLAWADERTLASLREMTNPPSQSVDLYAHILGAEHEWLCRIQGAKARHTIWPKLTLPQCAALAQENQHGYTALVATATAEDRQRLVRYRNTRGAEYTSLLEDILVHVAQHGAYHRGQVALLVRASGGTPILTDFIAFTREAM